MKINDLVISEMITPASQRHLSVGCSVGLEQVQQRSLTMFGSCDSI